MGTDPINFRALARQLGVGRFLLRLRAFRWTGVRATVTRSLVRRRLLPRILKAPPIAAGEGAMELHMLLHKARFLEGGWALYSFLHYAGQPFRVVIHSDGSLDTDCSGILSGLFPGVHIIPRAEADTTVNRVLKEQGLNNCIEFRRRHILGLKLIDPFVFCRTASYLLLDSDILTYSKPHEIIDPDFGSMGASTPHLYSVDCWDGSYACSSKEFSAAGIKPAYRLNSGIVKIQRSGLSLERIERTISKLDLLGRDHVNFYAEQTLFACELPCHGAVGLDPERYTICGDPDNGQIVTGHYCGDYFKKTLFYRKGIPRLARELPVG